MALEFCMGDLAGAKPAKKMRLQRSAGCGTIYIILAGLLALALRAEGESLQVFQAKLVVLNAPRQGQQLVGNLSYHVRIIAPNGEWVLYSLIFGPNAAKPGPELKTGDAVQLLVELDQSGFVAGAADPGAAFAGAPGTLFVSSWAGLPATGSTDPVPASSVYYTGGSPLRLRMAVWAVTSVCGEDVEGGMNAEDVSEVLFGPPAGAALLRGFDPTERRYPSGAGLALNRLLYECSDGAIGLKRSNTLVLNLSLPCSAQRPNGATWNATRGSAGISGACSRDELWGWIEYAVQNTQQVLGLDLSQVRRRVLVLPPSGPGALCPDWQQRGSFGCDETLGCEMWIQGDRDRLLQWTMTQLGSSMLLQPASRGLAPAGPNPLVTRGQPTDPSCPMGSAEGTTKCFNGPSTHKLFLVQPLVSLDAGSGLAVGDMRVVQLPAAALSPANLLLVQPNWQPPPSAAPLPLYGQYRAPVGGDAGLPATMKGRLVLHSINASSTALGLEAAPPTVLLAALAPGESYRFEPAKVIVSFQSWTPPPPEDAGGVTGGSATVSVCRYLAVSETSFSDCFDGIDNDCDGLVDDADPDCAAAVIWQTMKDR